MGEWVGVLIAIVSSALGGTAATVTRYLVVGSADPLTLSILRWGIGFVCVLPVALALRVRWPARGDWLGVALLGFAFYGLFFILLQSRGQLHDRRAREPRPVDAALADHDRRRAARHRGLELAQDHRRVDRGAGRLRRPGLRTGPRTGRRVARRAADGKRGAVHGVLQRLLAPVHPALQRSGLPRRRHGRGRDRPDDRRAVDGPP